MKMLSENIHIIEEAIQEMDKALKNENKKLMQLEIALGILPDINSMASSIDFEHSRS